MPVNMNKINILIYTNDYSSKIDLIINNTVVLYLKLSIN